MQELEDFFKRYRFKTSLIIFVLAQLIGTGLAIGLANCLPVLAAIPGMGMELLMGMPALLIILTVWLQLVVRKINVTEGLGQIFARITPHDVVAIVVFNLAIGVLSILAILLGIHLWAPASLDKVLEPKSISLAGLWIGAVTSTTLAPISEEIVFRGWLFNALRRRLQLWLAILLSSLAFAAIHPSLSFFTTFLFGSCAAILYYKTNNLWVSILVHALNNLLIASQSIAETSLVKSGLVSSSHSLTQLGFLLGVPSLLLTLLLGHYLVVRKRFFDLRVPLLP